MTTPDRPNRRRFLGVAGASALAAPTIVRASALGGQDRPPPSERLTLGFIGVGKMNRDHLARFLKRPEVQVLAVCDVDTTRREDARAKVESAYGEGERSEYKGCGAYNDFRELLDRDDIDAVVIATPDHWHAIPVLEACRAKKDIYCEKPLSLTIREAKLMIDAVRKHDRVFQTGSQQRSEFDGRFRTACEYVRSGRIGKVQVVHVGVGDPSVPCDLPGEEPEPGLDWDRWLGPAPERPYNSILSPRGVHDHFPAWRSYREYSGGGMTDFGAHHFDIAQWGLGRDESGPVEILPPEDERATRGVQFVYDDGVVVVHGGPSGITFVGTEGLISVDRDRLISVPDSILKEPLGRHDVRLYRSPGHHQDWLDCIKTRKRPICDVEVGARSVTVCHLGNLAYWHRKPMRWDPQQWSLSFRTDEGESVSEDWLDRERRDPWQLPEV